MHFASSSIFIEIDTIWTAKWVSGRKRKKNRERERERQRTRKKDMIKEEESAK